MVNTMKEYKSNIINNLSQLMTRAKDAEQGFTKASEEVESKFLKSMLEKDASQRRMFAQELAQEIRLMGGEVEPDTSLKADLHRSWIDFRTTLIGDKKANDQAVIDECLRGESQIEGDYKQMIEGDTSLTGRHQEMLNSHLSILEDTRKRLKSLEKTALV
jgi:uncharacterized protein (TIGR02284 family)